MEYVELPMAFDAITVAVNPKNDWIKTMTVTELKKMWEPAAQGKITKWSQINLALPDEAFKLYGAGAASDRNALGFFGFGYYMENQEKV